MTKKELHDQILELVKKYCDTYHNQETQFKPGDRIHMRPVCTTMMK